MAVLLNSLIFSILENVTNYNSSNNRALVLPQSFLNLDQSANDLFKNIYNLARSNAFSNANDTRYMNSSELIRNFGYRAEEYTVESGTGYLLNVMRIPSVESPVLLVHGITGCSDDFLTSGTKSLAYILAKVGYDVWLINCRGNVYSRRHIFLSPDDPEFWKFTFHQIGTEDLPATIDFILKKTNRTKLAYIGHSQGTTVAYIMLSKIIAYNSKLSVMISLAPSAWLSQMFSPIVQIAAKVRKLIEIATSILGVNEFFPSNALTKTILRDIFGSSPFTAAIFDILLFLLVGFSFSQIDHNNVQNQVSHIGDGSSIYQVFHYLQNIDSGDFKEYDYGERKNVEVYGSPVPPAYGVEKITCKMFFFIGTNDWISDYDDLKKLTSRVQNVMGEYKLAGFNHIDYLWARDVKEMLYFRVIDVIKSSN